MKHTLLALLGTTMLATGAHAETSRDHYVSGALGYTFTDDSNFEDSGATGEFAFDNAPSIALALGKRFKENWRGEIELSHREADIDRLTVNGVRSANNVGDLETTSLLVNGYYDFRAGKKLRPYLSAGVGLARHEGSINSGALNVSENDTVFAYQLGAGVSYAIKERTSIFGGYRYNGSSDVKFDTLGAKYDAHEIRVGLAYAF